MDPYSRPLAGTCVALAGIGSNADCRRRVRHDKPESAYATAMQTAELHGPPRYFTIDWLKSKTSVEALAALKPDLVMTGHGRAMQGTNMTDALEFLARDFDRIAVPVDGKYVDQPATVDNGLAYVRG